MDCRLTKLQARRSSIARPSHSLALTAASAAILGAMITLRSKKQRSLQQGIADFYDASTGAVDQMWVRFWPGAFMCYGRERKKQTWYIMRVPLTESMRKPLQELRLWGVWVEIWGDHLHHGYYEDNSWRPAAISPAFFKHLAAQDDEKRLDRIRVDKTRVYRIIFWNLPRFA